MTYTCSGIYGLGIYDVSIFLKRLYETFKPSDVVLVTFGINISKAKVLLFNGVTSLRQSLKLIKPHHVIIVSDNPLALRTINGITPLDYLGGAVSSFELQTLKKITVKPNRVFSFERVDIIKEVVDKNTGSDFVTAYIQLISHAPEKHRQTLKTTLTTFFKQGNLEQTLEALRALFPASANFMATRFIYKLEEEGMNYFQAISSEFPDDKAAEKFKLEQYAIGFFRRQK